MTNEKTLLQQLTETVSQGLVDTPYILEPQKDGFRVTIDLADAKWWMPLNRQGLKDVFIFDVRVDEKAMTYSINDTRKSLDWKVGVDGATMTPTFALNVKYDSGRLISYTKKTAVGITDEGNVEKVVDYTFSPSDRKGLIIEAAEKLGFKRGFSGTEKVGLIFGIIGGAFALVCLLAALIFGIILK